MVKHRALGPDGKVSGKYDHNPMNNSIICEVKFIDGMVKEYAANVIVENMLLQVDSERVMTQLLQGIIDYKRDESVAVSKADKYIYNKHGRRHLRKPTVGWWLLVWWQDHSETWMKLCEMKESYPIKTAEFAVSGGIDDEPAFIWWVRYTI